jgi:hypothetical protein
MGKEKVKCYAIKHIQLAGKKPNEFIKGQPLELSAKEFERHEANGLVAEKRPALNEYECIQLEKRTGEKVKPAVKAKK